MKINLFFLRLFFFCFFIYEQNAFAEGNDPISLSLSLYEQDASVVKGGVYYSFHPRLRVGGIGGMQKYVMFDEDQKKTRERLDFGIALQILLNVSQNLDLDIHTVVGTSKYKETNKQSTITYTEFESGLAIGPLNKFVRLGVGYRLNVDELLDQSTCSAVNSSKEFCQFLSLYPFIGGQWSI